MDDEMHYTRPYAPTMPRAEPFEASPPSHGTLPAFHPEADPLPEGKMQAGVFQRLVNDDGDIAGLVAYSIYKQNKLDWLRAFEAAKGRAPDDAELVSYIIGEETPRRLATYRHLAEATLTGHGPEIDAPRGPSEPFTRRRTTLATRSAVNPGLIATYVVIALVIVVGFWLALHFTMSSR